MNKDKEPLSITHPEIAKEAYGWDPSQFSKGSVVKVSWKCSKGHTWNTPIYSRTSGGSACPFCSNQKVLPGFNDLATTHPELAKEAHGWDPTRVIAGTPKKLDWICDRGHVWEVSGNSRVNYKTKCPFCSNQKVLPGFNDLATTHPELAKEAHGWDPTEFSYGSKKNKEWICSRSHIYECTIKDRTRGNNCPNCSNRKVLPGFNDLATTHPELAKEAHGWDPTRVIAGTPKKLDWICDRGHVWKSVGYSRILERGCPFCSNQKVLPGFNDLATTHPELAKEAHGWDPTKVVFGSVKKLQWTCNLQHTWFAEVRMRIKGNNCPYCGNKKVLPGFNDLATTHPELAKEAIGRDIRKFTAGSDAKIKWKCNEGHVWTASISHRVHGSNCPSCSKSGFDPNLEGYLYFLLQPNWELYQIGITNYPQKRLLNHRKNGFELLELRGPMDGRTAQELETLLLRYLKSQKADLSPEHIAGKFDGYSESWTIDSFKVNNLKELIDKANEAGF